MKCFVTWILMITLTACTTMRPIDANPTDLSQRIAAGGLLKPGDRVTIETKDRQTYEFEVMVLSATSIDGKHQSVRIDQVASIHKRVTSGKKTFLLAGLILIGGAFTVALVHAFQGAGAAAILGNTH